MASAALLLCLLAPALPRAETAGPIAGGKAAQTAFEGWLSIWRSSYKSKDSSVPEIDDALVPKALAEIPSKVVISSGGAASGVVTEGMGYAIMIEGFQAARGSKPALLHGLALTRGWLAMVTGPNSTEHPLGGGDGTASSATEVGTWPYGVSAIAAKGKGVSGVAAWKYPIDQCAGFCAGSATDGDEDAILGMIYLAEALGNPKDFVDMVIRGVITFASADLGFPDLYRTLPDGTRVYVAKGGSDWGGLLPAHGKYKSTQEPWCYNPSYFAPAHYRAFRDFISKHWRSEFDAYLPPHLDGSSSSKTRLIEAFDGAITAGYNILYHSSCSSGAVANWVGVKAECSKADDLSCEGVPWATTPYIGAKGTCTASGTLFGSYGPDASRTPWRIAMDYVLYTEESTNVAMYSRAGKLDRRLKFDAQVYLNRFAHQYVRYSGCDGGEPSGCIMEGKVAAHEIAAAFISVAKGLTCKNVPNPGQDWWAAFMSYPTMTAFVVPHEKLSPCESASWIDTLAATCNFTGGKPKGPLCDATYFGLGQEVISTMVMAGAIQPLASSSASGLRKVEVATPYVHPAGCPHNTSSAHHQRHHHVGHTQQNASGAVQGSGRPGVSHSNGTVSKIITDAVAGHRGNADEERGDSDGTEEGGRSGGSGAESCRDAFQQCGGIGWTGARCCKTGCTCKSTGGGYSQCAPPTGNFMCAPLDERRGVTSIIVRKYSDSEASTPAPRAWLGLLGLLGACILTVSLLLGIGTIVCKRRRQARAGSGQWRRLPAYRDAAVASDTLDPSVDAALQAA